MQQKPEAYGTSCAGSDTASSPGGEVAACCCWFKIQKTNSARQQIQRLLLAVWKNLKPVFLRSIAFLINTSTECFWKCSVLIGRKCWPSANGRMEMQRKMYLYNSGHGKFKILQYVYPDANVVLFPIMWRSAEPLILCCVAGMTCQARTSYTEDEVLWGHRFESCISLEKGAFRVDYSAFDKTFEVQMSLLSAKDKSIAKEQEVEF